MYKVKRIIYVDNQSIDVWFGLVSKTKNGKNGKYTVYLLTDDPNICSKSDGSASLRRSKNSPLQLSVCPPLWWRFSFKNRRY